MIYNCVQCHKDFEVEQYKNGKPKEIFCSEKCRKNYNKENIKYAICKNCSKSFITERYMSGKWDRKLYCCVDCEKEARVKNQKQEKKLICLNCKNEFIVERTNKGQFSKSKFCSTQCAVEYRKIVPVSEGICKVCGKKFKQKLQNGRYTQLDYCSEECKKVGWRDYGDTKELICNRCGKVFLTKRGSDDCFLKRQYCDDCLNYKEQEKEIICQSCGESFIVKRRKIDPGHFVQRRLCDSCLEKHYKSSGIISQLNIDFANRLSELNLEPKFEFTLSDIENKRSFSYDIKVGDVLIEINPTYTHSVIENHYGYSLSPDYHVNKTQFAQLQGYHCINIWNWDNINKIIQLIKPKQKLYARKLQLKEISKQLANTFLDKYHIQGSCYGNKVNIGLFNDNELVQVMTFGKPRYNKNYQYELLRLCSHSDYKIVGGVERLFKYFIRNSDPQSIISYCDISKFTGDVYKKLGFNLLKQTEPQKVWSKNEKYITDNLLRQRGFDQLIGSKLSPSQIYGKGTNNEELMLQYGWLPVYDCGQKVFIWKRE